MARTRRRHQALATYLESTSSGIDAARHVRVLSVEEESELDRWRVVQDMATAAADGQPVS